MARFEDAAGRFWDTTSTYGLQPPLTSDLVAATESTLHVNLPRELLVLLRLQNGGTISRSYNRCPSAPNFYSENHVPFTFMFGVGPASPNGGWCTLLDTPHLVDEWNLPAQLVLLYGEGHYWVALDYRSTRDDGEPSVTWIDNEMEHELPLAPSFRTFVEQLTSGPTLAGQH